MNQKNLGIYGGFFVKIISGGDLYLPPRINITFPELVIWELELEVQFTILGRR